MSNLFLFFFFFGLELNNCYSCSVIFSSFLSPSLCLPIIHICGEARFQVGHWTHGASVPWRTFIFPLRFWAGRAPRDIWSSRQPQPAKLLIWFQWIQIKTLCLHGRELWLESYVTEKEKKKRSTKENKKLKCGEQNWKEVCDAKRNDKCST